MYFKNLKLFVLKTNSFYDSFHETRNSFRMTGLILVTTKSGMEYEIVYPDKKEVIQ